MVVELEYIPGITLLEALRQNGAATYLQAPCGGKGTCGKCIVRIAAGECSAVTSREREALSADQLKKGMRLACQVIPEGFMQVELPAAGGADILSSAVQFSGRLTPLITGQKVQLPERGNKEQVSLFDSLRSAVVGIEDLSFSAAVADSLARVVRRGDKAVTLVLDGNRIVAQKSDADKESIRGFAVDIGTTTMVVSLVDMVSGTVNDRVAALNPQSSFGSDVISRISHASEKEGGLRELQDCLADKLLGMMKQLSLRNGIDFGSVYCAVLAGNTSMLHLFSGVFPLGIAQTPYVPVFTEGVKYIEGTGPLGGSVFPGMITCLIPCRSAYIGADITAGVAAVGMDQQLQTALFVDIGTNGEIVLGNSSEMVCCATAAGPAFEGAHIACGTGSVDGAIFALKEDESEGGLHFSTLGGAAPAGICGSGIIDCAALLYRQGLVDRKGRFLPVENLPLTVPGELKSRRIQLKGEEVFLLAAGAESAHGEPVYFSQKDLREVQLAKAAVAAGIQTLLDHRCIDAGAVEVVYLAGGFGSAISVENAFQIGLLPSELEKKVEAVGNTAQRGAVFYLLSEDFRQRVENLRQEMEYLELSFDKGFSKKLMAHMYLDTR